MIPHHPIAILTKELARVACGRERRAPRDGIIENERWEAVKTKAPIESLEDAR